MNDERIKNICNKALDRTKKIRCASEQTACSNGGCFKKDGNESYLKSFQIEGRSHSQKAVLFMECGIHAREWISPATCMFLIDEVSGHVPESSPLLLPTRHF